MHVEAGNSGPRGLTVIYGSGEVVAPFVMSRQSVAAQVPDVPLFQYSCLERWLKPACRVMLGTPNEDINYRDTHIVGHDRFCRN